MERVMRVLVAAAVASTVVGATAGPSSAERWWGRDRAADVQQITLRVEPTPCRVAAVVSAAPQDTSTDLVGLSVVHGRDSVVLRAHLRELKAWGERGIEFDLATDGRDFQVHVSAWGSKLPAAELLNAPSEPEPAGCDTYTTTQTNVPCDDVDLQILPARDVVAVTVPRSCLGDPRWVRAGAHSERFLGVRARIDVWGRPDSGTILDPPPLSPRIRHSR
jgi:hypothetical protein